MITFPVRTGKAYTRNALLSGDPHARRMQSPMVHDKLLDITTIPGYPQYLALRTTNPLAASAMRMKLEAATITREKKDPRYWVNNRAPRRPVVSSSSFIGNVSYSPDSRTLVMNIGGKRYTVPAQTPLQVKAFLESPSLGRYFNQHFKVR